MNVSSFIEQINGWGRNKTPFFFLMDFELKKPLAYSLEQVNPQQILFDIQGFTNAPPHQFGYLDRSKGEILKKSPITFLEYKQKYMHVLQHLDYGDSYLTNLTIDTEIALKHSLLELFYRSHAKYKLWYDDAFLVFSPETFVQIKDQKIYSFPMKGTIDAAIPAADITILNDQKELAEHTTIVDLIRNDLSQVASKVVVNRFRYIDQVKTSEKVLLQVSSEITGELDADYASHLGEILVTLLPAGSVSGAPKSRTMQIIREAEGKDRGYYTGIVGYYDGQVLDSGVMIRFIERKDNGSLIYRSGGGITTQSIAEAEYQEAIDKVYVPVD